MIKVGDKVTFGRSGEKKRTGTVKKKSPKTARIAVPGDGGWNVSYNFMQKVGGSKTEKGMTSGVKTALLGPISTLPPRSAIVAPRFTTILRGEAGFMNPADGSPPLGVKTTVVVSRLWLTVRVKVPESAI